MKICNTVISRHLVVFAILREALFVGLRLATSHNPSVSDSCVTGIAHQPCLKWVMTVACSVHTLLCCRFHQNDCDRHFYSRLFQKNTAHISRKQSQWLLLLIKGELVEFFRDPPQKPLGFRKRTELMAHGLRASHHIWTGNPSHEPRDCSSSDTQQTFQLRRKVSAHLPSTAFCEDGFPFHVLGHLGVE